MISNGNKFTTTTEGYNYASLEGIPEIKTDPDSILQLWISKFRAGASRMLKIIAERYPNSISKEELGIMAAQYSHTSGTFNTYLSDLRRNGLIKTDTGNTREIIATKELFFEDNNGDN